MPFYSYPGFSIGIINFYTWGIFLALGIFASFLYIFKKGQVGKIPRDLIYNLFVWILIGIIMGARLGYIIQFIKYYSLNPWEIFKVWQGGLTFYGGLIGGISAFFLFFLFNKQLGSQVVWQSADLIASSLPIGITVGRIGCLLINDHQGEITNLPWGIIWPDGTTRHPVALYLIINALIIFLIINLIKKKTKKSGRIFFIFLFLYSISRFFLDFTRSANTPLSDPRFFNITLTQWASLVLIIISLCLFLMKTQKPKQTPDNKY